MKSANRKTCVTDGTSNVGTVVSGYYSSQGQGAEIERKNKIQVKILNIL